VVDLIALDGAHVVFVESKSLDQIRVEDWKGQSAHGRSIESSNG
jgi:Holliday junction resolvase-like predicted endonuclease